MTGSEDNPCKDIAADGPTSFDCQWSSPGGPGTYEVVFTGRKAGDGYWVTQRNGARYSDIELTPARVRITL
ncbi:hypothetical protein AB0D46_05790 [Streptomyces sp. NPDC048383]|uniref:hypothetical protein n=1 Tax=Streptomyces sp. NPDC048383 TaxID=3155386 RepID=UPI003423CAAA